MTLPHEAPTVPKLAPGDVCVVKRATDTALARRKGFWAIVRSLGEETATLSFYDGTVDGVDTISLKKLFLEKPEREKIDEASRNASIAPSNPWG